MKDNNKLLFRCLIRDLGYELFSDLEKIELDSLRKQLMQLAEGSFDSTMVCDYKVRFYASFRKKSGRAFFGPHYEDLSEPETFRKHYQILSFSLKTKDNPTYEQEQQYIQAFKTLNTQCRKIQRFDSSNNIVRLVRLVSRRLSQRLCLTLDAIAAGARHGPGATFDRSGGDDKSFFERSWSQLRSFIPDDWFFANHSLAEVCSSDSVSMWDGRYIPCRLTLVPKDWKGPRGVFISPKEAIFCQIGIDECFKRAYVSDVRRQGARNCSDAIPLQPGVLRTWIDPQGSKHGMASCVLGKVHDPYSQLPNQESAMVGSYSPSTWSTLDLSDASDRISIPLVRLLFHRRDFIALACTRPTLAYLPNGETLRLSIFSPMGDGKTFAVLTWACMCISLASMMDADGILAARPPNLEVISEYASCLRVFGDDIAVSSKYFEAVCSGLEIHNLKVNRAKSFSKGHFRESCGVDAFKGEDITPLRLRVNLNQTFELEELFAFRNRAYCHYGELTETIQFVDRLISRRLKGKVPFTSNCERNPFALMCPHNEVFVNNLRNKIPMRWNEDLHRWELYGYTGIREVVYPGPADDRYRLNYALFPKQTSGFSSYRKAPEVRGSKFEYDLGHRLLKGTGLRIGQDPRSSYRRGWVEMDNLHLTF